MFLLVIVSRNHHQSDRRDKMTNTLPSIIVVFFSPATLVAKDNSYLNITVVGLCLQLCLVVLSVGYFALV